MMWFETANQEKRVFPNRLALVTDECKGLR